jgi:hypothetical protein
LKRIDFETDLKNEMHNAFSNIGLRIPIRNKLDEMLLDYLTVHKKIVFPRPRNILISPDLEHKLINHDKNGVVELIWKRLEVGLDVNSFQSKRLFEAKFHDHLLYEWNVYHFHLSTEKEKKGNFVKRTDQLLFVYIEDNVAILLDIETHKEGIFADEKWLEIIDTYFPTVLESYLANDILDINPQLNSVERQKLWNYGLSVGMTKVNGKIIHSPGVGRMTSGHSILVTKTCNEILRWLHRLNEHFENNFLGICNAFNVIPENSNFKVAFGDSTLELIEANSKSTILKYPYIFNFNKS